MRLNQNIEIVDGLPFLFMRNDLMLVCSDLHLGYEGVMARRGIFLPKKNLNTIKSIFSEAVKRTGARQLIVTGDVKNDFSDITDEEYSELTELISFLKEDLKMKNIILIKGNHDNFLNRIKHIPGMTIRDQEFLSGRMLFIHGDSMPKETEWDTVIMGHVHPSIMLYDRIGSKDKVRCFLYGVMHSGKCLIIIPALNFFAGGIDLNSEDISKMSPLFKEINIQDMKVVTISEGESFSLGTLAEVRSALRRIA